MIQRTGTPLPACRFRTFCDGGSRWTCNLVNRILGMPSASTVNESVCAACCRDAIARDKKLNSVTASLVYDIASCVVDESNDADKITRVEQAKQFALTALSSGSTTQVDGYAEKTGRSSPPDAPWDFLAVDRPRRRTSTPRVGLVGPRRGFGLASQNWDIARFLNVSKWLGRDEWSEDDGGFAGCSQIRFDTVGRDMGPTELEAWLDDLDVVLFVESPSYPGLTKIARELGVSLICVANWEWLHPGLPWLRDLDVVLCPTDRTMRLISDWQHRFGFQWRTRYVPWPIDTARFNFVPRETCQRFVFVNGSGGVEAARTCGETVRRKGLDLVLAAADRIPSIPILIYTQPGAPLHVPPNVELRPLVESNQQLYEEGDVCIQPSRWEGLGLPLLECQAAGMPLITTDFPPMNEHDPIAVFPVERVEPASLGRNLCISLPVVLPETISQVLTKMYGQRISKASQRARKFVEEHHSWDSTAPILLSVLEEVCC